MTKSISESLKELLDSAATTPAITPAVEPVVPVAEIVENDLPTIITYTGESVDRFEDNERTPADWSIEPNPDDTITATHRVTRKIFSGTIKQFSQAIK